MSVRNVAKGTQKTQATQTNLSIEANTKDCHVLLNQQTQNAKYMLHAATKLRY